MFFSHARGCACLTFDRLRCACVAPFAAWAAWTAHGGQGSSAKKNRQEVHDLQTKYAWDQSTADRTKRQQQKRQIDLY